MEKQNNNNTPVVDEKIAQADRQVLRRGQLAGVLIKPVVTEKAAMANQLNQYVFKVADKANKIDVAKAVKVFYGIEPVSVNIINVLGKKVSRGRVKGQRNDWKKAIVTLPAGKTIQIYEGV
ncbi:MAG TPA: 50S ribosomal protein L23 [bacterium]|nr:50S ribosomal protein L23 [bacterium]